MASVSVTYTFANSTTADATQVNTNFTDIINGTSDGTKDFSINALTCAGTATLNGNVNLGNATGDDLTITASLASSLAVKTTYSYDLGSSTIGWKSFYLGSSDSAARTTRLIGATVASSWTMTLPTGAGTIGYPLVTDGAGVTSWANQFRSTDLMNIGIAAAVSANALTVSLKGEDGNDPSSTNPVTISFRNATSATGTVSQVRVTSALSVTASSGSTLGTRDGVAHYVYLYAINNAGTVELAISASSSWDEGSTQSTTAEGGAGAADSASVLYSTTARTGVAVRLIGRVLSTQTTAGTWASAPTELSVFPFGRVIESEVTVDSGNGYGSTNTKVRRYSNIRKNTGTAITYADSSTNGASFTINEAGAYSIHANDGISAGAAVIGITVNGSALTTSLTTPITYAQGLRGWAHGPSAGTSSVTVTLNLAVGDIVRPQDNGTNNNTDSLSMFTITQISKRA